MAGHHRSLRRSEARSLVTKGLRTLLAFQVLLATFVVFAPVVSAGPEDDWSEFVFVFDNGTIIAGDNQPGSSYVYPPDGGTRKKNQAWFPGTGGAFGYPDGPGMNVHVSCSDTFEDGWGTGGASNQPIQGVDTNWRIASYEIVKYTNGSFTRECGETFTRASITVVKNTEPASEDNFRFELSGAIPTLPSGGSDAFGPDVRDVSGNDGTYTWSGLDAGSYTLLELVGSNPDGYALADIACSSNLGADVSGTSDGVTIKLRGGEDVTCAFLNTASVPEEPGVDIEKATNGQDADTPTGPQIVVGGSVTWTYVVTNIGDGTLTNVTVTDDQLAAAAIDCGGGSNVVASLAPAGSVTCTASGTAVAGQYANVGSVTTDQGVFDTDPSHYLGVVPEEPAVDIEKATNGQDADTPTGPQIVVGGSVAWTYVVTNIGDGTLTGVTVTDDQGVSVSCPQSSLAPVEQMTCTASGTAVAGQYANVGSVATDQEVSDSDPSHYLGVVPNDPPSPSPSPSLGSIGDRVWDDGLITQANGHQDAGEIGISGITVSLYDGSGSTKLATTVTNASGAYLFTGLAAGSYVVEFVVPSDSPYIFTTGNPAGPDLTDSDAEALTGRTGVITLGSGADDLSWDAGLVTSAVLPQVITTTTTTIAQTSETLPFTGPVSGNTGGIGLALVALGSLVILMVRRWEDAVGAVVGGGTYSVWYRGKHRR